MALNAPTRYTVRHHFNNWQTLLFVLTVFAAEVITVYLVAYGLIKFVRNIPALSSLLLRSVGVGRKDAPQVFFELIFPAETTKSAFATEQLHILLRGLVKYYSVWDKLAARKKPYSLEVVGTNDEGIRFIIMVPASDADIVRRNLISFMPGLKVRETEDYTATIEEAGTQVVELKLNADFILPLKDHKTVDEHDLMSYLTGHMAELHLDELVAFQIVAVPVYRNTHHRVSRRQSHVASRIALGKEMWSQIKKQRTSIQWIVWLLWFPPFWFIAAIAKFWAGVGSIIGSIFSKDHDLPEFLKEGKDKRRSDDPYDQEMANIIKGKLDQQLYEVTMRLLVSSPDGATHYSRINALVEAFTPFRSTYQSIGVRQHVPVLAPRSKYLSDFKARKLSPHHLTQQTIVASSEMSDLYHFPNSALTKTEGLMKSRSRELAVPLSLKKSTAKLDVLVGVNARGNSVRPIGMTLKQRQKHTYVVGKTGTGKSTLLTNCIFQDMVNGHGLAVLDPHGDMFQELLAIVPEHRKKDVVIFDPSDYAYPPGLNLLNPGIAFDNDDIMRERITSNVISVFKKLADEKQWGPRMEHVLRSATLTALLTPNPSLYTLQRLLTEKSYQRKVAATLKDPVLKQFWKKEFALLGTMQMSNVAAPLTNRLGHFITNKTSRHILLQEMSTINVAEIMDEGKILLVNLSKGDIGEDQSEFFGTILTSFIWMAAYQRTRIPEKERRDFFLYVDEFQNFATPDFSAIASEGRKYHVPLIVSHQNVAQIEDKALLKIVVGNADTIICLKASPDDEAFILPYMKPEVEKGDIINLAPYHFYMKTSTDTSEDPFSGKTLPLEIEGELADKQDVVACSREQYGTPVKQVEEHMEKLFAPEPTTRRIAKPKGPKPDTPPTPKDEYLDG
jgi:hypothetical protein